MAGQPENLEETKEKTLAQGQDNKGIWWMPWCQEAKKDAASGEMPRGVASKRRSVDIRMGKPNRGKPLLSLPEYIGQEKPHPVN